MKQLTYNCPVEHIINAEFTDCADGLIIVGHSDVRWYRANEDYSEPGVWLAQDFEHDIGCDKYNILNNRSAVYQWWKWTPGLILSYTRLNWFQNLINIPSHLNFYIVPNNF